jgi:hypothetical protein
VFRNAFKKKHVEKLRTITVPSECKVPREIFTVPFASNEEKFSAEETSLQLKKYTCKKNLRQLSASLKPIPLPDCFLLAAGTCLLVPIS